LTCGMVTAISLGHILDELAPDLQVVRNMSTRSLKSGAVVLFATDLEKCH
jgi:hypothetical protein